MNAGAHFFRLFGIAALSLALACAGSNHGTHTLPPSTGNVTLCLTGNGIENWQGVDITISGVTLTPKDGSKPVALFTAPTNGFPVNLALLDHTDLLVGNFPVPLGTYSGATLTIAGSGPGGSTTVYITQSNDPSTGFPGTDLGNNSAFLMGQDSSTPSALTLAIPFQAPIVVTADQGSVVDLAFDLSKPTLLVDHGTPNHNFWSLDFDGVVSQRPITSPSQLLLSPLVGAVTTVAADGSSLSLTQLFKAEGLSPAVVPQSLAVRPDTTNGTRCWDLSSDTSKIVKDFSSLSGIPSTTNIVVAGLFQADGSVVAARIWVGTPPTPDGATPWDLYDGHLILPWQAMNNLVIEGETRNDYPSSHGWGGIDVTVDSNTQFFLRNPANPKAEATPIGTGSSFLSPNMLAKGFRVFIHSHWTGRASVARSVEILAARFSGSPSQVTGTQFTCSIPQGTNLSDPGDEILEIPFAGGFAWWNFATPSQVNSGASALSGFAGYAGQTVDFGGTAGVFGPWVSTEVVWGDPANSGGWSAQDTEFKTLRLPDGSVASPWVASANGGSFGLSAPGGNQTVTVEVNTASTLAYNNHGINTIYGGFGIGIDSFDLTIASGLASFQLYLARGWPVRVFGYPDGTGRITATTIFIQNPN